MTVFLVALTVALFLLASATIRALGHFLEPSRGLVLLYADGGQLEGRLCPECGGQLVMQDGPAGLDSPPLAECPECGWSEWEFNGEGLA
jgi:hypothetical protein